MHPVLMHELQSKRIRRMVQALQHIANGKSHEEAAALIGIQDRTLTDWLHELRGLMEVHTTYHLIAKAMRKKLIR